jgi:vitamin B12 transporter
MKLSFIISALLSMVCLCGLSQDTTLVRLDEALVSAQKPSRVFERTYPDSLQLMNPKSGSLADLLAQTCGWNLRSYGATGTLVTASEQGLLPDHVTVYWQGVPLNSPSLGLLDLSQIPVVLFDHVSTQSQPIPSASPVQSIGPTIELDADSKMQQNLSLGTSLNSISNATYWGVANYRLGNFQLSSKLVHRAARNEFKYIDPFKYGNPLLSAGHNNHSLTAWMQNAHWQISRNRLLKVGAWLQGSEVMLPQNLGSYGSSYGEQQDSSMRFVATYQAKTGRFNWLLKSAYIVEKQHFTDKQSEDAPLSIDSRILTKRMLVEGALTRYFGTLKLAVKPIVQKDAAESNYYKNRSANQLQVSTALEAIWFKKSWNIRMMARHDFAQKNALPVVHLAFQKSLNDLVKLELGGMHIYRIPDLNERFWIPGGSPDLQAEDGLKAFVRVESYSKYRTFSAVAEGFAHHMNQMIQWVPEGSVYHAVNTGEVSVVGGVLDLEKKVFWPSGRGSLFAHLKGEHFSQIPFYFPTNAPSWTARGNLGIRCQQGAFGFTTQVRGNINQWNPGVPLYTDRRVNLMHDATIECNPLKTLHQLNLQFSIQNIWNSTDWTAVYPIPGRILSVQVEWEIAYQKNSHKTN